MQRSTPMNRERAPNLEPAVFSQMRLRLRCSMFKVQKAGEGAGNPGEVLYIEKQIQ